jgi:Peptide methionine sulfoxide reductase
MSDFSRTQTSTGNQSLGIRSIVLLAVVGLLTMARNESVAAWSGDDETTATETAMLAGGCFWGMEDLIRDLDRVVDTEVGYAADGNDK